MLSQWLDNCCEISFLNIFAMISRILIGQLFFWFLEPTLKTVVIFANLKDARKIEKTNTSLNQQRICSANNSAFFIKHFLIDLGKIETYTSEWPSRFDGWKGYDDENLHDVWEY